MKTPIIYDEQTLVSAQTRFGTPIPVYDDGYGKLYISRDSTGINGIVRAQTLEDAYGICEDEFFPSADGTHEEWLAEYGEDYTEDACWQDAYGFRPNGRNSMEGDNGIYSKDLNGDYLDELTPELLEDLEITLEIETPVEPEEPCDFFSWHSGRYQNPNGRSVFSMQGRYSPHSRIYPRRGRTALRPAHYHYSPTYKDFNFNPEG